MTDALDVTEQDDVGDALEVRLLEAFRRYEAAYSGARPGTAAAAQLARARLDLAMLLQLDGEPLPTAVLDQMARDADQLIKTTPALADESIR